MTIENTNAGQSVAINAQAWTHDDEWRLKELQDKLNELDRKRRAANAEIRGALGTFLDQNCASQSYSVGDGSLARFLMEHKWELVEILTQGEYSAMCAIRGVAKKVESDVDVQKESFENRESPNAPYADVPSTGECGTFRVYGDLNLVSMTFLPRSGGEFRLIDKVPKPVADEIIGNVLVAIMSI